MPSISGPRSTAARGVIATPFIAGGAACWPLALPETAISATPTSSPAHFDARRLLIASSIYFSKPPKHSLSLFLLPATRYSLALQVLATRYSLLATCHFPLTPHHTRQTFARTMGFESAQPNAL